ncbi:hypothetical protein RhiirC2_720601 [Rhizophagus irregularis]|uniref:Uncharacterized protein n=1 Tax=Rhizophagus irregularis TaxID=588596 RepID=A0A2N1M9M5_9GLOM|nr:hypothetical protein RhiirC2_720601 [Rhizophagus irregularis]
MTNHYLRNKFSCASDEHKMHYYFNRRPSNWNINDFLNECNLKTTRAKLGLYIKCLETIAGGNNEDSQKKKLLNKYREVAGTSGQLLVEDLVEGFYVVFPGPTFEFPTRLQHIESLKSAVNIIKFVMDKYNQTNKIVENKVSTHNVFDDIFSKNNDLDMDKPAHCKSKPK